MGAQTPIYLNEYLLHFDLSTYNKIHSGRPLLYNFELCSHSTLSLGSRESAPSQAPRATINPFSYRKSCHKMHQQYQIDFSSWSAWCTVRADFSIQFSSCKRNGCPSPPSPHRSSNGYRQRLARAIANRILCESPQRVVHCVGLHTMGWLDAGALRPILSHIHRPQKQQ